MSPRKLFPKKYSKTTLLGKRVVSNQITQSKKDNHSPTSKPKKVTTMTTTSTSFGDVTPITTGISRKHGIVFATLFIYITVLAGITFALNSSQSFAAMWAENMPLPTLIGLLAVFTLALAALAITAIKTDKAGE